MVPQVFMSHSKEDPGVPFFAKAFLGSGVTCRAMELEDIQPPPWRHIRDEMSRSQAVFVLLSDALLRLRHTANWIAMEVGLACTRNLPVWVFEPVGADVDFSVPYCTHQARYDPIASNLDHVREVKKIIESLKGPLGLGIMPAMTPREFLVDCQNPKCRLQYFQMNGNPAYPCPSCRSKRGAAPATAFKRPEFGRFNVA